MKKNTLTLLAVIVALSFATISFAEEGTQENKFKRGLINIVTSPLEIPKQMKASHDLAGDNKAAKVGRFLTGIVQGVVYTGGRIGSGVWDIITFNLAIPANYEPLMKPNYVYRNTTAK